MPLQPWQQSCLLKLVLLRPADDTDESMSLLQRWSVSSLPVVKLTHIGSLSLIQPVKTTSAS